MKRNFKKVLLSGIMATGLILVGCNDDDEPKPTPPAGPTQSIVEIALADTNYSILVEALVAADLVSVLGGSGPFTVFAPDNAAFNALFDANEIVDSNADGSRVDELVAELGAEAVTATLLYHVLGASITASQVPADAYVTTLSLAGAGGNAMSLRVESRTAGVFLNNGAVANLAENTGAKVEVADLTATNGVIHGIDAVMMLPNIVDHAVNNPTAFSSLVDALVATGLVSAVAGDGPLTVFAPVNQAFTDIADVVATLSDDQLSVVLRYHVVTALVRAADIEDGAVGTLANQEFSISTADGVKITDATEGVSNVVITDVTATNGVVHVIDRVLIPVL